MRQSIDKKKNLIFYLIIFILLSTQISRENIYKSKFNIKISQIKVLGLSNKNNIEVSNSLNFLLLKNIFFINKQDIKKILNDNYLIESFSIQRHYPNILKINIKKTNFLAITSKDNKKFYIGSNGKLIPVTDDYQIYEYLPFVFSNDKYENFVSLKKIIDLSKFKFEDIESFYRFPSNRWDIKTKDGLLIKLPEKNILNSLELAHTITTKEQFKKNKIIDLRISKYIITSNE